MKRGGGGQTEKSSLEESRNYGSSPQTGPSANTAEGQTDLERNLRLQLGRHSDLGTLRVRFPQTQKNKLNGVRVSRGVGSPVDFQRALVTREEMKTVGFGDLLPLCSWLFPLL